MRTKRNIALLLSAVLLVSLLGGCQKAGGGGNQGGDGDALKVSWWISQGEDSKYYPSYAENPVVQYLESKEHGGVKVDFDFVVPISGNELDNFNTLLMTDEYCGIMDMSITTTYAAQLYEDGYIWDLTPYIDEYMPNYKAVLAENEDLLPYMCSVVNGEKKMLSLYYITGKPQENFTGFLYRRDWIVKYGANPQTGAAFTCGYQDPANPNTYYDDVVFPSGGTDPVYISDWEWMFEIFTKAMADLGIADGYCYSPYFKGYNEAGIFNSSFGGGTAMWSVDADGNAYFGGDNENMRACLQCLNNWYEKGWLDKSFVEHTGDQFYTVDSAKIHQGKVGLWIGRSAETGANMDIGDAYTSGIMAYGCRLPINDVYGGPEQQNKEPDALYQYSRLRGDSVITNKVSEEDLPKLLQYLDFFYTREGGLMLFSGLTKSQTEEIQPEMYSKFGLNEGAVWEEQQADGTWTYGRTPEAIADSSLWNPLAAKRLYVGYAEKEIIEGMITPSEVIVNHANAEWDYYLNTGYPDRSLRSHFTEDETASYAKIHANVDTFMATTVPKFISGDLDIDSEKDWGDYCKMLNKYGPDKVTAIYQRLYNEFK